MAGIGFDLRRLVKQDNLLGAVQAFFHAAIASSGPWILTILTLQILFILFRFSTFAKEIEGFRAILLYNFAFSLVLAAPFSIVTTRCLADQIYCRDFRKTFGMLLGTLILIWSLGLPISVSFYFFYAKMTWMESLLSVFNFLILLAVWLLTIFNTAVRHYRLVSVAFFFGFMVAIIASPYLQAYHSTAGLLTAFNIGLGIIFCALYAAILVEYPKTIAGFFDIFTYLRTYWVLALGALFYNLALWVDKWIFWFSPIGVTLSNGLIMAPSYEETMLIAYLLTIIPGMAIFLVIQETNFFEAYYDFYQSIQNHGSLEKIQFQHRFLIRSIVENGRQLVVLQFAICLIALFVAPQLFELLELNFIRLGMFRYAILGATFQTLMIYVLILLYYFNYQTGALWLQLVFLFTNTVFSWIFMKSGFAYYGYGYFLSTIISFVVGAIILGRYIQKLPYHAFITSNASVTN